MSCNKEKASDPMSLLMMMRENLLECMNVCVRACVEWCCLLSNYCIKNTIRANLKKCTIRIVIDRFTFQLSFARYVCEYAALCACVNKHEYTHFIDERKYTQ